MKVCRACVGPGFLDSFGTQGLEGFGERESSEV